DLWPSRAWLPVRAQPDEPDSRVVALVGVLWISPHRFGTATRRVITSHVAAATPTLVDLLAGGHTVAGSWSLAAQTVLDMRPGAAAVLCAVRDGRGKIVDYRIEAASPDAVDVAGRQGRRMVGLRVLECYPTVADSDLWRAYEQVLDDGESREVGPFTYVEVVGGLPAESVYSVRVHRWGAALLIAWVRHDEQQRHATRLTYTERLGNLGWAEWDLASDTIVWSDHLYAIFERDPGSGPGTPAEIVAAVVAEDMAVLERAVAALMDGREPVDLTLRVRLPGGVKHLRIVGEVVVDAAGDPVKAYGIVQDVTAPEQARRELAAVQARLADRQRILAAEHRVAAELQRIILPLPDAPVELPGLVA